MTPDNEFYLLVGGGAVGLGILALAVTMRLLATSGDFFRRIRRDKD